MFIDEIKNPKGTPLRYDKFKQYEIETNEKGHWIFKFPNNYGASVIKHYGSYNYEEDKFELAVLHNNKLTYSTPITDDVIGWLSNDEVINLLETIKSLKE